MRRFINFWNRISQGIESERGKKDEKKINEFGDYQVENLLKLRQSLVLMKK